MLAVCRIEGQQSGKLLKYKGQGTLNGDVLIISANYPPFGKHDLHCDLFCHTNSKCWYYETSNHPEFVDAKIIIHHHDESEIHLTWIENSTEWDIYVELAHLVVN